MKAVRVKGDPELVELRARVDALEAQAIETMKVVKVLADSFYKAMGQTIMKRESGIVLP